MFQQLHTAQLIDLYLQGKFFLPPHRFPNVFRFASSIRKLLLLVSDGGSQLRVHSHDAEGWGHHPMKYTPQPGWNQPRRYPFLSHTAYSPHATYLSEGAFMPLQSNMAPKLSRTTTILLVFQADSEHKQIINVYVGLVVCRVDCHLYSPNQINDFIQDIDVNLQKVHNALKAGCDAGKKCTYCLFVDNLSGIMSIPTDPPYCLVYPTTYVKGAEPDHFNTHNSPTGMRLHHCVCRATLQFSDTDPQQHTKYGGSHLIIPHGAQYDDHLFPTILEPRNHRGPLIDPVTGETCPMEVVGDFRATDPIFKGSYGDSFLYLDDDLVRLRWQKVYLPIFQEEIPVPAALSYRQSREPVSAKQSPCRVAAPNTAVESITTRRSSSKGGAPQSLGHNSKTSPPKCPDSTLAKTPPHPQKSTPDCPAKSPQAHSSWKHGRSPSPATELAKNK